MFHDPGDDKAERPRAEPEIIPPGTPLWRSSQGPASPYEHTTQRIYVARLGPVAMTLLLFGIGLLTVILLLVLIGAALIWAAVLGVVVAGAIITGMLRQRFRGWR